MRDSSQAHESASIIYVYSKIIFILYIYKKLLIPKNIGAKMLASFKIIGNPDVIRIKERNIILKICTQIRCLCRG